MEERNNNYCEGHIKLCEDLSYIKASVSQIKDGLDTFKRIGIVLIAIIATTIFWSGHTYNVVQDNKKEIRELRNAERAIKVSDMQKRNERGQLKNTEG